MMMWTGIIRLWLGTSSRLLCTWWYTCRLCKMLTFCALAKEPFAAQ